jgi:hypothetical protein
MDRLEESLKAALARKDPPPDFAQRVAARARTGQSHTRAPWWLATAAGLTVMMVGSGVAYRRHQGEVAKEQVMQAMKITAVKLHRIQSAVAEVRQ